MFPAEHNQISICLLKSNLEEIESDLVDQRSACPELDAECEQKYRKTLNTLNEVHSLGTEKAKLDQENLRLAAIRKEQKRQSDHLAKALENTLQTRSNMEIALHEEEQKMEQQIRRYEDSLREKAERFRKTRGYYNEEEMRGEIAKVHDINTGLEAESTQRQAFVDGLRCQLDGMQSEVPEDLLALIGQQDLEKKVEFVTKKYEDLQQTLDGLLAKK